jgi:hypothetical protein
MARTSEKSGDRRESDQLHAVELEAYGLLEGARLRCECLLQEFNNDELLLAIHRDLGMAGYLVSMPVGPVDRAQRLAAAYSSVLERWSDPGLLLEAVFEGALIASDAIGAALIRDPEDHLCEAHRHTLAAVELLDSQLAVLGDIF